MLTLSNSAGINQDAVTMHLNDKFHLSVVSYPKVIHAAVTLGLSGLRGYLCECKVQRRASLHLDSGIFLLFVHYRDIV